MALMDCLISLAVKPADADALRLAEDRLRTALPDLVPAPVDQPSFSAWRSPARPPFLPDLFASLPVDWFVQPWPVPPVALFIADMDSTMITVECIDEIADMLGLKPQVAAITARAMAGELPFEAALEERVGLLQGLPEADLARVYAERVRFSAGAEALLAALNRSGVHTILASGGFTYFTGRVAAQLGFSAHFANDLEVQAGRLTGRLAGAVFGPDGKRNALRRALEDRGIDAAHTVALGDGANDRAMLTSAGQAFGHHPKAALLPDLDGVIRHTDLSVLATVLRLPT